MKRNFALLLTSLLLVFSLTACGKDQQQPGDTNSGGAATDENGGVTGGDTANGSMSANGGTAGSGMTGSGSAAGNAGNTLANGANDVLDGARNAARDVGDAITGRTTSGSAYDRMVENGRVF